MPRPLLFAVALALTVVARPLAQAPAALPLGAPVQGAVGETPTDYAFAAKTAGVLSVAVQGTGDLSLQLLDDDGQVMPDGTSDRDLRGNDGTELFTVTLTEPGNYRVRVRVQGGSQSTFTIAGSYLSFPLFQRPGDPDRRPSLAKAVGVGKPIDDALDPDNGDAWDWFVLKATQSGTLTVVTRPSGAGEAPDLRLELYTGGDFSNAADRSDQDLQSNSANETVSVNVKAGEAVHVKVSINFSRAGKYRLSSSLAP